MRSFVLFLLLISAAAAAQNEVPIGSWREHLPYHSAVSVVATDQKIFAATPYSLFSVHITSGEVQRFSRINGLSETGISTISYDAVRKKLVVAYRNSNIDILGENSMVNVPGLKREPIPGNKTIYQVYPAADYAYLATGIGILLLDLDKNEIRDSWFLGPGGSNLEVYSVAKAGNFFYAATAEGLKRANLSANPADYRSWQSVTGLEASRAVVSVQDQVMALQRDSLFVQTATGWQLFYANGLPVHSIHVSGDKVVVSQPAAAASQVVFLNVAGGVTGTLIQPAFVYLPRQALQKGSDYWLADEAKGLTRWTAAGITSYNLNSPEGIATGEMVFHQNRLYAAAGSVDAQWNPQNNSSGIYQFSDQQWTTYNGQHHPVLDSLRDFITVAADPRDGSFWAGSFGGGMAHIKSATDVGIYKQASPIEPVGQPGSYRVSGLAFDAAYNLWITNYGAARFLHVLKPNGSWQSFAAPFSISENAVAQIIVDDANQKWIVGPKGNGLLCFHHGNSIDITNDDRWLQYKAGATSGNLPSSNVLSIAADKEGALWVGTDDGIAIIPCPWEVFATGCPAVLPVVKDGNFANYLFKGEAVHDIAVDGADRKWIATSDGAWLVSPAGDQVLAHFTEANSPLLSNDVRQIAVNGINGEVFFGTAKGICSYKGTATEAAATNDDLLVFPNPVPPGYTGSIAIKGLAVNSFVKITELNGRLAFQARALGGQVVWNGRDYNGRKIASGIYLVIVTDENKTQRKLGRIVFISR